MEKTIDALLDKDLLKGFLDAFGLGQDVKKLGDFENFVYEVFKKDNPYILRLTHNSHRSGEEIASEIDWMRHLHSFGISVPEVYLSKNGLFVEAFPAGDGSVFFGCLFSKAKGEPVKASSEKFDDQLFKAWGETIGLMHKATKSYEPKEGVISRKHWYEDDLLEVEKYYPDDDVELIENARQVIANLRALPRNPENYGLIHTDIHSGNFFYDGERVHVFDFDDASYHWFGSDIAIPLYYSLFYRIPAHQPEERKRFSGQFMMAFMEGYEKANILPDGWQEEIPLFLMLRDVVLFAVFHKKIAPEDRNEQVRSMMAEIRERIKYKQPIAYI